MATFCDIHGRQDGLSCVECDKDADADVLAARELPVGSPSGDPEFEAFKKWKADQAGSAKKGKG